MNTLARWVLVFEYEYWDPDAGLMRPAELPATLEAIRSGLGRPVLTSGRKVLAEWIDSGGILKREALPQPKLPEAQPAQSVSQQVP
jgi:hypothetical protein